MFDIAAQQQLKSYVYGLFDPRSPHNIPFYIGKGTGNRVFSHAQGVAKEIQSIESEEGALSAKAALIAEIGAGNVRHVIFRQGLSEGNAFTVEASLIDLVNFIYPEALTNIQGGHHHVQGIRRTEELLAELNAKPVNPTQAYQKVFIFPIQNALREGRSVYDATRYAWKVSEDFRNLSQPTFAVGLDGGLLKGAYRIQKWEEVSELSKHQFEGDEISDFANTNWRNILNQTGYWQRGNYLVVEFDGKGQFRFLRGSQDKTAWLALQ